MGRSGATSLKDVAQHAGVSVSTVSRVLNDGPYVTAGVRARVEQSMQQLGYLPHAPAKSLRTGQTLTVGFLIGDIANPLFATIARGIDDELQQSAYTMLLANSRGDAHHERALIAHLLARRVDGLILSLADETAPGLGTTLAGLAAPLVLLDREVDGLRCDQVLVDHATGVAAALRHLLACGHRRIALISGPATTRPGRAIAQAFVAALAAHGLPDDPALRCVVPSNTSFAPAELAALLALPDPPTALLAGGALITPAVLRAVQALGLRIPADLALVAYDDTDLTALCSPALTVVARDVYAIGLAAARLLLSRLRAPLPEAQAVTVPTRLVVRGSTAAHNR